MAYRAAAFLQWIYQYVWPIANHSSLLVAHAYVVECLLVCLRPLASHLFAAALRPL